MFIFNKVKGLTPVNLLKMNTFMVFFKNLEQKCRQSFLPGFYFKDKIFIG